MRPAFLAILLLSNLAGEQAPRLPEWLRVSPGAKGETIQSGPRSVEQSYEVQQPPEEVVGFYRAQIQQAGLQATANFDGIGTSIRVLAQGVSSVITVREGDSGTRVQVEYAITGIQLPNAKPGGACLEGTRIYYSESRGRSVCSEAAPLVLVWPAWLGPPGGRRMDDPKGIALPVGWYGDPSLTHRFESPEKPERLFEYYRQVFRDRGFTSWGQSQSPEPWLRGMQRPVKNVALDPKHILPEFSDVQYVRQVYVSFAKSAAGTQVTITLQVHNPKREARAISTR